MDIFVAVNLQFQRRQVPSYILQPEKITQRCILQRAEVILLGEFIYFVLVAVLVFHSLHTCVELPSIFENSCNTEAYIQGMTGR